MKNHLQKNINLCILHPLFIYFKASKVKPLNIIVIFALILFSNTTLADSKTPLWSITDLQEPESMLVDKDTGLAYISNMNGPPTDNNGQGYISLVSADGKIIKKDWVTGLGAPKGMALHDNYLYVADLQTLHKRDPTPQWAFISKRKTNNGHLGLGHASRLFNHNTWWLI